MKEPRMLFGFALLGVLVLLASLLALGKVTEAESFGLMPIVMALGQMAAVWGQWAFRRDKE